MRRLLVLISVALSIFSCSTNNPYSDVKGISCSETISLYTDHQDKNNVQLDVYIPDIRCGKMVVICPSSKDGNIKALAAERCAARWFSHYGISACVFGVKGNNDVRDISEEDIQSAFRYCHERAVELEINEVGIFGISEGCDLAVGYSAFCKDSTTTPDFQILLHPQMKTPVAESDIIGNTPRTFIALSHCDSSANSTNILNFYDSLANNDVEAELDIYPSGGHGWAFPDHRLATNAEIKACKTGKPQMEVQGLRDELYSTLSRWLGVRMDKPCEAVDGIAKTDTSMFLYPAGQESDLTLPYAETALESNGLTDRSYVKEYLGYIHPGGGDYASIDIYLPENPNGQLVVICPGGGYSELNTFLCGRLGADFFKRHGIASCVLNYRMPNCHKMVPLQDVQNAIRYCRGMAKEWGITQIGVLGSSAGGHLAACASNMYKDKITRPDFAILLYPVITFKEEYANMGTRNCLIGKNPSDEDIEMFSMELHVTPDTPPTFLACNRYDWVVKCENFTLYQKALWDNNVNAEFHAYNIGTHGWAFASEEYYNYIDNDPTNSCNLKEAGKGILKDDLGNCRKDFETSLLRWMESLVKTPAPRYRN